MAINMGVISTTDFSWFARRLFASFQREKLPRFPHMKNIFFADFI